MFSPSGKKIPCVGVSIGVERVFAILYARFKASQSAAKSRTTATDVFVIGLGSGHLEERMKITKELWDAGISTEFTFKEKPRRDAQFKYVTDESIPVSIVVDNEKVESGTVQVENNSNKEKVVIPRAELVSTVKTILGK
jgi:histidyl-tRNA synthetase